MALQEKACGAGEVSLGGAGGNKQNVTTDWKITRLEAGDADTVRRTAELLFETFGERAPEWPDVQTIVRDLQDSTSRGEAERINLVARADDGAILGFIGGVNEGNLYLWELDPLAVREDRRRQGIGEALVAELERLISERGALTLFLGTDDWNNLTSLGGIDLFPDVLGHLAQIRSLTDHPYLFYQKQGFVIVGTVPDANGWGKPDILLAKRVGQPPELFTRQ